MEKNMSAVSIRLPDDVSSRLQSLAQYTGRSKTYLMIEAIRVHISDLEDIYIAERELEEIRAGRSTTVPLAEVMKQYGMGS
jgi:RHH-type rel operon transcriptional repressor/antitoxin RelB